MTHLLAPLLLVVVLLVGGCRHLAQQPDPARYSLLALDGDDTVTGASLQGKVVVLLFWTSSCAACRPALRAFDDAFRALGSHPDVVFLAVNAGTSAEETPAHAQSYLSLHDLQVPGAFDADGQARWHFDVEELPTALYLDRRSIVRHRTLPSEPFTEGEIRQQVAVLMQRE